MANSPLSALGGLSTSAGGTVPNNGPYYPAQTYPPQSYCLCGSPATRIFFNPKGISYNLGEVTPSLSLCSGCDFRFTVMRAAGRSEEFITEYEEKQKVRAEEEARRAAEFNEQMQKEYYQRIAQQAQNIYGQPAQNSQQAQGLLGQAGSSPETCTENVQTPAEQRPWWKNWANRVSKRLKESESA